MAPNPKYRTHEPEAWHRLLTSRFVCRHCLTRYFTRYPFCPACHQRACIFPLDPFLNDRAQSETELRELIASEPVY